MAGRKYNRFINGHFNKFFSEAITTIPDDYKRFFSGAERMEMFKTRNKLLKTILEDKLYFLAKLGYRFALVIADSKKKTDARSVAKMIRIFRKKAQFDKKGAIAELQDAGAFVLTDVDFVRSMTVISGIYGNEDLFNLVRTFSGVGEKLYRFHQDNKQALLEQKAVQSLDAMFSKIVGIGAFSQHEDYFEAQFKINAREYVVLAFISKNRYCKHEEIRKYLGVANLKETQSLVGKKMLEEIIIQPNTKEFYITGTGEMVLQSVRQYFLEPN